MICLILISIIYHEFSLFEYYKPVQNYIISLKYAFKLHNLPYHYFVCSSTQRCKFGSRLSSYHVYFTFSHDCKRRFGFWVAQVNTKKLNKRNFKNWCYLCLNRLFPHNLLFDSNQSFPRSNAVYFFKNDFILLRKYYQSLVELE